MESDRAPMSVAEAAQRLQRSTEQVRRYLREGRLQGRRIGGQWFIDRAVLDTFLVESQRQQNFVHRIRRASEIHPLDDVIGIGAGAGSNIGEGKAAYRRAARTRH